MQMDIKVGRRAEALDERDRAGACFTAFESRDLRQKARDDAVEDLQHRREQVRVRGEKHADHATRWLRGPGDQNRTTDVDDGATRRRSKNDHHAADDAPGREA